MSLSGNGRKLFWQDHKDSLNRIRSQLGDRDSPVISPRRSPGHGLKHSHSPLGLYRRSSPSQLPRIDTPPLDNDGYRTKIRGSRYDVVPPVNNRRSNHQTPDYDSWGEESDDEGEEEEEEPQHFMPLPYPYPMYGYPAYQGSSKMHPPPVVYGNPFPVYYPPPPVYRERGKKRGKGKQPVDRLEVHQSYPAGRKSRKNGIQFTVPREVTREPRVFDTSGNDILKKYRYIYPRDSPLSRINDGGYVEKRYRDDQESLMNFYFKEHPVFAENFTDWLTLDLLDEIIPDILIETLTATDKSFNHSIQHMSVRVRDDIVDEVVKSMTREAVRGGLGEMVNEYMGHNNEVHSGDPLVMFLDKVVEDAIQDCTDEVVRDTVREMASDHMRVSSAAAVVDELVLDHLQDIQRGLVDDIVQELVLEEFIESYVIEHEVEEEIAEIAKEVLEHYDTKIEKRELREVSKKAGDKLMESLCLEYLLSLISRQGKVWNESDHANRYLDDMIMNLLLGQYSSVIANRDKTLENQPLKKLHEKVVSDVALDLLLQQLSSSLDEDLADVDEYERGVDDTNSMVNIAHLNNFTSQRKKRD
ncbi:uncharacterized protein LOC125681077 isoform X2 [Ostrea edulis]|uniref:uncharacterized protein LOC125681077 isoform X2 n=1 Tax=Ostrea edulis TaxID=37623 RepID=UPI0024AEB649|nr:uncharacterized protein LOC125681077 isoform X2 [Ostrea edulis]